LSGFLVSDLVFCKKQNKAYQKNPMKMESISSQVGPASEEGFAPGTLASPFAGLLMGTTATRL